MIESDRDLKKQNTKALKQLKWRMDERIKQESRGKSKGEGETEGEVLRDSQHEVLLPAGQVAPDSNGCALHILYL